MAQSRTCPHCGARVYETDDVCMSCGRSLTGPAAPAPAPEAAEPAAEAKPSAAVEPPRPQPPSMPSKLPWTQRVIGFFGGFWELFPWFVLALIAVGGILRFAGIPPILLLPLYIVLSGAWLGVIFWTIVDIIDSQATFLWLAALLFCQPIGLIGYLLVGRS